jgi:multidrug efflux pump subunit AcrA (membrane-fusion protein)
MIARTLVLQGIILIALSISGCSGGAVSGGGGNNPAPISVASVTVSPTSPSVTVAGTAQFTATAVASVVCQSALLGFEKSIHMR